MPNTARAPSANILIDNDILLRGNSHNDALSSRVDIWSNIRTQCSFNTKHSTRRTRAPPPEHTYTHNGLSISIWIEINSGNVFNCWRPDCISFHNLFAIRVVRAEWTIFHVHKHLELMYCYGVVMELFVYAILLCASMAPPATPPIQPPTHTHTIVNLRIYCRAFSHRMHRRIEWKCLRQFTVFG